jgi:Arc/MetJ-type ribon-helix-helix transcriptional regulator
MLPTQPNQPSQHRLLRSIDRAAQKQSTDSIAADANHGVRTHYERFAISMPASMAMAIRELCEKEARSHSEFFREAVRHYLVERRRRPDSVFEFPHAQETPSLDMTLVSPEPVALDPSFADFAEWLDDSEYNRLLDIDSL